MEALKGLLEGMDPTKLLPDLDTLLGRVELGMWIAVMVTPLVLLGMGLLYFLAPPKEATHKLGYRFFWGMSSVEVWSFTQRLAGILWSIMGLVLCIVMTGLSTEFRSAGLEDMIYLAIKYILWEMVLVVGSILLVNLTVFVCFNRKGIKRGFLQKNTEKKEES